MKNEDFLTGSIVRFAIQGLINRVDNGVNNINRIRYSQTKIATMPTTMSLKIYVASSWRNTYQPAIIDILRELGHEVYDFRNPPNGRKGFAWSDIDRNWENWTTEEYRNALQTGLAQSGFDSDFEGMKWADCCVMILPCGRSANTEAGWMKGAGKQVFVYSPEKCEPELMYKMHDGIISDIKELKRIFRIDGTLYSIYNSINPDKNENK